MQRSADCDDRPSPAARATVWSFTAALHTTAWRGSSEISCRSGRLPTPISAQPRGLVWPRARPEAPATRLAALRANFSWRTSPTSRATSPTSSAGWRSTPRSSSTTRRARSNSERRTPISSTAATCKTSAPAACGSRGSSSRSSVATRRACTFWPATATSTNFGSPPSSRTPTCAATPRRSRGRTGAPSCRRSPSTWRRCRSPTRAPSALNTSCTTRSAARRPSSTVGPSSRCCRAAAYQRRRRGPCSAMRWRPARMERCDHTWRWPSSQQSWATPYSSTAPSIDARCARCRACRA